VPVQRIDETWHRLREWTYGQAPAERLAGHILRAEGFDDIDPSHPLGGRDGGKDAVASRDGARWIMAVYFPRGQQSFKQIKAKFKADFAGVTANDAEGMAFVTNQELRVAERRLLERSVDAPVALMHLERITSILDQPTMHAVRQQFLAIPLPGAPGHDAPPDTQLVDEFRTALRGEFGFLDTRGLPRDLRQREPRLEIDRAFVPLRVRLPTGNGLVRALECLSYRERRIIELRLGLGGEYPRTLDEVGSIFNVSRERVRSIESRALASVADDLSREGGLPALGIELDLPTTMELIRGRHEGIPAVELLRAHRLIVLGGPGSGKSTLTRYVMWALASQREELPESVRQRVPFRISANEFARALESAPTTLVDFAYERAGRFAPILSQANRDRRLMLLLDGLDEVTDPPLAGRVQDELNRFLCDPAFAEVAMLLTSRIVGFHPVGPLAEVPDVVLAPLTDADVERFATVWFSHVEGIDADRKTKALMGRLRQDTRMAELATSPLLLTVLALLHARDQELPNERAQLYAAATETLLESWPLERRATRLSFDTVPSWLAPLAREVFLSPPKAGVPEDDVIDVLVRSWQSLFGSPEGVAREQTRRLLQAVQNDSGLLCVTGYSSEGNRLWDFLHRSFAEYLVARAMAEASLRATGDPLELAERESWREVILMTFGELGRRRPQLVGPLLDRLVRLNSTPWEDVIRRDLRLALSVLGRDVPCEERHAVAVLDTALVEWSQTAVLPLREHLATTLCDLAGTRYARLLATRADELLHAPEQRLMIGRALTGHQRQLLLEPLLDDGGAEADEAAIALLADGPCEPAITHLLGRLSQLDEYTAVRAAAAIAAHQLDAGIEQLVLLARSEMFDVARNATEKLASIAQEEEVVAAMEELLDLAEWPLEPIIDRLAAVSSFEQIREVALGTDERRFGAFALLHRIDAHKAAEVAARFDPNDFEMRLHSSRVLGTFEDEQDTIAAGVLGDPNHPARLWAAEVLASQPRFADEARRALLDTAASSDPWDAIAALHSLASVDPPRAVAGFEQILRDSQDPELRREAVYLLNDLLDDRDTESQAADALAMVLDDPDDDLFYAAAMDLLHAGDQRALRYLVDAVSDGRVDDDAVARAIARVHSGDDGLAVRLLGSPNSAQRRLGARLLALASTDQVVRRLAIDLLDDRDATVRCAAAWTLAFGIGSIGQRELKGRLGPLLEDVEHMEGPPVEDLRRRAISASPRSALCCADVAYRLLEENPTLLGTDA
jgi:Sigma-70, region 4/NACHT domain/HEAT repeats